MKNKIELSKKEKHELNYLAGNRIASIVHMRRFLMKIIKIKADEQGYIISKEIIQKINREIEMPFIGTLCNYIFTGKLTIKYVDENYDRLFFMPNDTRKSADERVFDEIPLKTEV